jgi:hypothetical protein
MLANRLVLLALLHIGRLFESLILLHVGKDSRLLASLGEPAKGFLEGLTWSDYYSGHGLLNSPTFGYFRGFSAFFSAIV